MKSKLFVFGIVFAAFVFLYKRLIDTEKRLILTESERDKLQREQDAMKESFMGATAQYKKFKEDNPLPDDVKLEIAMKDAIHSANARDEEDDS